MIQIREVTEMSQKVYDAFERLIPQLSSSAKVPTWEELEEIVLSKTTIMLAAVDDEDPEEKILGTMTLVVFRIPSAWEVELIMTVFTEDQTPSYYDNAEMMHPFNGIIPPYSGDVEIWCVAGAG